MEIGNCEGQLSIVGIYLDYKWKQQNLNIVYYFSHVLIDLI